MENARTDTSNREIFVSRTLSAPIELVWEVWTDPDHISQWWGPEGFKTTISTMDMRQGGEWNLIMHGPDGTDYKNKSIFTEIILHKRIKFDHVSYPEFKATLEFEDRGDKTFIKWHMLFESAELLDKVVKTFKADEGLKQNVDKLEKYLENINADPRR